MALSETALQTQTIIVEICDGLVGMPLSARRILLKLVYSQGHSVAYGGASSVYIYLVLFAVAFDNKGCGYTGATFTIWEVAMGHSRVPELVMMVVVAMIVPTGFLACEHYHSVTAGVLAAVAMPVVALAASWVVLIACVAAIVPPVVVFFRCLNRLGFRPQNIEADGLTSVEGGATGNE